MSSGPVLSIIMPVRNEGLNLRIVLKILSAVVEAPHEVLVVVDQPDDESVPIVEVLSLQYGRLALVHNTHGVGILNAMRAGVAAAQGKYVLIFAAITGLYDRRLADTWQRAHVLLDRIVARHGALVIGAFSEFERRADRESLFADGVHLTEKGDDALSELLFRDAGPLVQTIRDRADSVATR